MKKILIIRFSSIGDIVLTTPVIRCLKKQLGAELHFLTKKQYLPLLEFNPYLDKIFTIEKKVKEILPALKKENYDCIVDLHKNLRSWQVRSALLKKTHSFNKLNFKKWLFVNFKINHLPQLHIVERYLKTVEPLDVKNDGKGLDYFLPTDQKPKTKNQKPFIAFAIGAAHNTKRLPTEKTIEICKKLRQPVFLLGGENESDEGEAIAVASGKHVTNLCGKLSLRQSAELIRDAESVITP